jgi:predicted nuclease of predicted toxin-antitoxin system
MRMGRRSTGVDEEIYVAAQRADLVVMTKDVDFVRLQEGRGPPPRLVWLT